MTGIFNPLSIWANSGGFGFVLLDFEIDENSKGYTSRALLGLSICFDDKTGIYLDLFWRIIILKKQQHES